MKRLLVHYLALEAFAFLRSENICPKGLNTAYATLTNALIYVFKHAIPFSKAWKDKWPVYDLYTYWTYVFVASNYQHDLSDYAEPRAVPI